MKNVKELRDNLVKKYIEFEGATEKPISELSALTACASAIIRSAKVEMDYKKYTSDKSEIDFLKTS